MGICRPTEKNGTIEKIFDFLGIHPSREPSCDRSQSIIPSSYEFADRVLTRAQESWRQNSHFLSPLQNRSTVTGFATVGSIGAVFLLARRIPVVAVAEKILLYAAELKAYLPIASPIIAAGLALFSGGCEPTYDFPLLDPTTCNGKASQKSFVEVDPNYPDYLSSSEFADRKEFVRRLEDPIRQETRGSLWQFSCYNGVQYTPTPNREEIERDGTYDEKKRIANLKKEIFSAELSPTKPEELYFHEMMHWFSHGWTGVEGRGWSQNPTLAALLACSKGILKAPKECLVTTDQLRTYPKNQVIQNEEKLAYVGQKLIGAPLWSAMIYSRNIELVKSIPGTLYGPTLLGEIEEIQRKRGSSLPQEWRTDFEVDQQLRVPRLMNSFEPNSVLLPIGQGSVGFVTRQGAEPTATEWITLFVPNEQNPTGWNEFNQFTPVPLLKKGEEIPYTIDFNQNLFVIWAQDKFYVSSTVPGDLPKIARDLGSYPTHHLYQRTEKNPQKQAIAILDPNNFMIFQHDDSKRLSYRLVNLTLPPDSNNIPFRYPADFQRDLERATFVKPIHLPNGKIGVWLGGIGDYPRKKGILYKMKIPAPFDLTRYSASANGPGPVEFEKIKEVYVPSDETYPRVYQDALYLVSLVKDATYSSDCEGSPNIVMVRLDDALTPVEWDYTLFPSFIPQMNQTISVSDLRSRITNGNMNSVVATENGFTFFNSIDPDNFRRKLDNNSLLLTSLFLKFKPRQ